MKTLFSLAAASVALTAQAQKIHYPTAPHDDTVDDYFGVKVADPYRPLENDTAAATAAWVKAENAITDAYLAKIPERQQLLKRMEECANYERVGAPFYEKSTGKWYFYRNSGLQNQSVLYVMDKLGDEQHARVFLDPNRLSTDGTVALKGIYFSHNGKYCAYAISRSGSDWQEFYVLDTHTGQLLKDHIEWAKFSGAAWQGDGFYYSAYDKPDNAHAYSSKNSTHKIFYHRIGTPQSADRLFYQNAAYPMRFYDTDVNDEETAQLLYESGAGAGNTVFIRDLRKPDSQFMQMTADMDNTYAPIGFVGDTLYILTNDGAPRYRLMATTIDHPGFSDWKTVIPEKEDVLESAALINGRLVLQYMKDASDRAYVYSLDGQPEHEIMLPGLGSIDISGDKNRPECFISYWSFTQPTTVYRYDFTKNRLTPFLVPKTNFSTKDYITRQVFFRSKDGTRVPMFITMKKGTRLDGRNPLLLYGYGGFNISMPPNFSSSRIPFLERGGIYAQVNLRGGGEYGEAWHLAGTKMHKQNVFDDFIAAAEYLIANKYTDTNHLAINGGSNGGLLIGAVMTQRPDLFKVCIPQVGVMDMLRYHKFTIGWNWASDYGTSDDSKEMFEYLRSYSPLHNLRPGVKYPATLITTADHDDRVVPAHSFKFAATLQADNAADTPTLIRIDSKAGHGGGKPLSKRLEEQADIYAFILHMIHP